MVDTENINNQRPVNTTIITRETNIEGTIQSQNDIEIYGTLNGKFSSDQSTVSILAGGHCNGSVTCRNLTVAGSTNISANISKMTSLEKSALFAGNLECETLQIQPGAKIDGILKTQKYRQSNQGE
jgi:cytoskeletal protein CcmA (bactofilin family)